jgi:4-alpha-glucanotransferase
MDLTKRRLGVVAPLAALRGGDSIGIGEFPDLVEFAALAKKAGLGLIQLLPVNDSGYDASPYFALTAFALNPVYIKIGAIPEAGGFEAELAAIRAKYDHYERFDYYGIARAKIGLLRKIFAKHEDAILKSAELGALASWVADNDWVMAFSVYRCLKERNGEASWKDWQEHRHVDRQFIQKFYGEGGASVVFWVWLQFIADSQFRAAAGEVAKLDIILEGDLPILMNVDSADAWSSPEYFNQELSAGAPPDMYSAEGQNWGFPTYDWDALEKSDFSFWKLRLKTAERYYSAYRIDHVLGFFRIWATDRVNISAAAGRMSPSIPVTRGELTKLGFGAERIRWLSRPHVPTEEIMGTVQGNAGEARPAFDLALDRVGNEDLYVFRDSIKGEREIRSMYISDRLKDYLCWAFKNRTFNEAAAGEFYPMWLYRDSRAWKTLSEDEIAELDGLIQEKSRKSEVIWEMEGAKVLAMLKSASKMLPCAEDLGAVPDCVPKTLADLGILGLRVVRWARRYGEPGDPYIPLSSYPELSVCTGAVHDSSTIREWWEREADQAKFSAFLGLPAIAGKYNPGAARTILLALAGAASRFRVFQVQDLLHLSSRWYARESSSERVNVPGSYNNFNWTYRLPAPLSELAADAAFIEGVRELSTTQPAAKKPQK